MRLCYEKMVVKCKKNRFLGVKLHRKNDFVKSTGKKDFSGAFILKYEKMNYMLAI